MGHGHLWAVVELWPRCGGHAEGRIRCLPSHNFHLIPPSNTCHLASPTFQQLPPHLCPDPIVTISIPISTLIYIEFPPHQLSRSQMLLRPHRPRKRKGQKSQGNNSARASDVLIDNPAHLVPVEQMPRQRLAPFTSHLHLPRVRPVFTLPNGQDMTQVLNARPYLLRAHRGDDTPSVPLAVDDQHDIDDTTGASSMGEITTRHFTCDGGELQRSRNQAKKEKQWRTWMMKTIPSLLQPYLKLLRDTESLRDYGSNASPAACTCISNIRQLDIICVYFERESLPHSLALLY